MYKVYLLPALAVVPVHLDIVCCVVRSPPNACNVCCSSLALANHCWPCLAAVKSRMLGLPSPGDPIPQHNSPSCNSCGTPSYLDCELALEELLSVKQTSKMNTATDPARRVSNPLSSSRPILPAGDVPGANPSTSSQRSSNKRNLNEGDSTAEQRLLKRQTLAANDHQDFLYLTPPSKYNTGREIPSTTPSNTSFALGIPPSPATSDLFSDIILHDNSLAGCSSMHGDQLASEPQFNEFSAIDDAILQEFIHVPAAKSPELPPSSILREFDNESTSTADFDPTLQYSPAPSTSRTPVQQDDLSILSTADVSWDHVRKQDFKQLQTNTSPVASELRLPELSTNSMSPKPRPTVTDTCPPTGMLLKPNRTWFHFQEMLKTESAQLYTSQPGSPFELFARVLCSRRENIVKKQYFRIRDLFKIRPPYLSAVLAN